MGDSARNSLAHSIGTMMNFVAVVSILTIVMALLGTHRTSRGMETHPGASLHSRRLLRASAPLQAHAGGTRRVIGFLGSP